MMSKAIDNANSSANRLEGTMTNVKSILGALGVAGGIAGMVQFGRSMVEAGTKVEDATTGLTTLLKDSAQAAQVVSNTMEDATKTPFGFESLLLANKALISAGVNANVAREDVMNLANAIAATGGGDDELQRMVVNLQQISNTGEATAQDLKQFAFAGVNLTKVLGDAGIKLAKGQQATYAQITYALKKAHDEGGVYFNGLENMMGNSSIKISNLEDAFFQFKVRLFQTVQPALNGIIDSLIKLTENLMSMVKWVSENREQIKALAIGLGTMYTAMKIAIPMMEGMGLASTAMLGPLGLVAGAIALITYGLYEWAAAEDNLRNIQDKAVEDSNKHIKETLTERVALYEQSGMAHAAAVKKVSEATRQTYVQDLSQVNKDIEATQSKMQFLKDQGFSSQAEDMTKGLQDLMLEKRKLEAGLRGVDEFAKGGVETPKSGMLPSANTIDSATPSKSKSVAQGTKVTTINVSIKDLIGEYNMNVTNVKEGTEKIKQIVVDTLMGAVNDFQMIVQ
jgi:tape measure domain-containing protein